ARAWRRKLNHAPVVAGHKVRIESPAEAGVERLGTLDVRNGNDDDLELHVDRARRRGIGWSCHGSLLWLAPAPEEQLPPDRQTSSRRAPGASEATVSRGRWCSHGRRAAIPG